ncbi:MAG: hypothetical protein ABIB43_01925 [archaeon]
MTSNNYFVFIEKAFHNFELKELAELLSFPYGKKISEYGNNNGLPHIWSGRLSSGIIGLTNCVAGNRGPKEQNEVLLGVGIQGLDKLVDIGFVPCVVCHPEKNR